jgi:NAD(P)-dependent dehydrogenase (short-subunit alcohol dehydrogenase family)
MARVLITGSADGLGREAARLLIDQGHAVTLHARDPRRAEEAHAALPGAEGALVGDLAEMTEVRALAARANAAGPYDAVIHNAGVGYRRPRRAETGDGLEQHFAVNVLAPYLLSALIIRPERLVYLSSGMHLGGEASLEDPQWTARRWSGPQAYSDSKLFVTVLAAHLARLWPDTYVNAVDPGWVATRMGGPGAPDDLELGGVTQSWLAVSDDPEAMVTGGYFFHQRPARTHPVVGDAAFGARLVDYCASLTDETLTTPP